MTVQDVFHIRNRGTVATGRVESGTLRVGDVVQIGGGRQVTVAAIEAFRRVIEEASVGDTIGVLLRGVDKSEISAGAVLTSPGAPDEGDGVAVVI